MHDDCQVLMINEPRSAFISNAFGAQGAKQRTVPVPEEGPEENVTVTEVIKAPDRHEEISKETSFYIKSKNRVKEKMKEEGEKG